MASSPRREDESLKLCKRWARGESCDPLTCVFRHTLLSASEEGKAQRAQAQRKAALAAQREADDLPDGAKAAHTSRHVEFIDFVRKTFGDATLREGGAADIGGGRGDVSYELHCRLRIPCTLIDPREVTLRSHQRKYLRKHDVPMFPHLNVRLDASFEESAEGSALLSRCTLLGLHPDEARTRASVCCVHPLLVRTWSSALS